MIPFKDTKNKSALSTRWAQMSKQEQIIEKKKMEIQAKLEAQKQAVALAAEAKLTKEEDTVEEKNSNNIFSNDGSFMRNYKALLEKQRKEKEENEKVEREKEQAQKNEKIRKNKEQKQNQEDYNNFNFDDNDQERSGQEIRNDHQNQHHDDKRWSDDRGHRDRNRRWSDRGRNRPHSPFTPVIDDRKKHEKGIPSLMNISVMPPDSDQTSENESDSKWLMPPGPPNFMPPTPDQIGSGSNIRPKMGPGPNMEGNMGPGQNMGQGPYMGQGPNMGPSQNMGQGPNMGPGQNMPPGPGSNMGSGPGPNNNMGPVPLIGPGSRPGMPPMPPGMMPPGGPRGPMHPFMGGPPNFPPFMGPNGPGGPIGPGGPNGPMCGPNGPMPPFFRPPFPGGPPMMHQGGPRPPPNSMMPPNAMNNGNMPFMPPFGPNGPNFGNGNGPPMPFMPPNSMLNAMPPQNNSNMGEERKIESLKPPPLPPMPYNENSISNNSVLSADMFPPTVQRAAAELARNGDHWENALKAIHAQDQNMWFLHNPNSNEYKAFRELVGQMRRQNETKREINPEDKYEPEFCLEDDDSNDINYPVKQEHPKDIDWRYHNQQPKKHDYPSSQSDEEQESKKESRRRKKSRWGDDPPVDIKPPALLPTMPGISLPGVQLAKADEGGLKLSNLDRNNQALMQYALTNYGTVNLSPEDWKKCEENFKLNLLYQDMMKKRQEVERLAAAGKFKYEYDSDEDTTEGTWEHKLRAREMNATEKWADELTKQAAGKHHIGDFLPPEELKKFMEKYSSMKSGKKPDFSDYKEFKLKEDNLGFKMLQKLGWNEGQGLGAEGSGIVDPINKGNQPMSNLGLGAASSDTVSADDDEFDAYRKRMMLAYRFRPNPLNNPRRPYY